MVYTNKIEELRALAFASIPAKARKGQQPGGSNSIAKRRRASEDREDGELSSDEENAEIGLTSRHSIINTVCKPLGVISNCNSEWKGGPLVACESHPACIDTPGLATVGSGSFVMLKPQDSSNSNLHEASPKLPEKEENGSQDVIRTSTDVKIGEKQSVSHYLDTCPASFPSRTVSAPFPVGGARKEAEAFLRSLKIPVTTHLSRLPGFPGERSSSLVIRFSDDESDSEGEHRHSGCGQGEAGRNGSDNSKWTTNGLPNSSGATAHQLNSLNQPTVGLKSEIDRVKKQIVAIEQIKGKSGAPAASIGSIKATSQQRQISTVVNPRGSPVDLESLRQQIAAKESALQLRKQCGVKELTSAAVPLAIHQSNDPLEAGQALNSSLSGLEKYHSKLGVTKVTLTDVAVAPLNQINVGMNPSSLKSGSMEELHSVGSIFGSQKCQIDATAVKENTVGKIPVPVSTSQPLGYKVSKSTSHVEGGKRHTDLQCTRQIDAIPKMNDTVINRKVFTPKRKRSDSELLRKSQMPVTRIEKVKKQKREEFLMKSQSGGISQDGLSCNVSQEKLEHTTVEPLTSRPYESVEGQLLLQSKSEGISRFTQGLTTVISTVMKPQHSPGVRAESRETMLASKFLNGSTHKGAADAVSLQTAFATCVEMEHPYTTCETTGEADDISSISLHSKSGKSRGLEEELSSIQITKVSNAAEPASQEDGNLEALDAFKEKSTAQTSSPTKDIAERQEDTAPFSESGKGLQGVLTGANSTCSGHPVWSLGGQLHKTNFGILQGISEKVCEFGFDSVRQMQEEEDLIDKELEMAQQSRRKCEFRERLARRQYREAQEALHAANLQCDILYQKREALAARIKATQIQFYPGKVVIPSVQLEGTLVPRGLMGHPGGTSSFRTSFWDEEDQKLLNLPIDCRLTQDNPGSANGSTMGMVLPQNKQQGMCERGNQEDTTFPMILGLHHDLVHPGSNSRLQDNRNQDVYDNDSVRITAPLGELTSLKTDILLLHTDDSDVHQIKEGGTGTNNSLSRDTDFVKDAVLSTEETEMGIAGGLIKQIPAQDQTPQQPLATFTVSKSGSDNGGLGDSSGILMNMGVVDRSTGLSVSNLGEADFDHVVEEGCHHGFSSASFATDLDGNRSHNVGGHKDAVAGSRVFKSKLQAESQLNDNQIPSEILEEAGGLSTYDGPVAVNSLENSSSTLSIVPNVTTELVTLCGTSLTEAMQIEPTDIGFSEHQHVDVAEERPASYVNDEAAVKPPVSSLIDASSQKAGGQENEELHDCSLVAKLQGADTSFVDNDSQCTQDKERAAKGIEVPSMELFEDVPMKDSQRDDTRSAGSQVEWSDDIQMEAKLESMGTLKDLSEKGVEGECFKTSDAMECQFSTIVKDVPHNVQSNSVDTELGIGPLFLDEHEADEKYLQANRNAENLVSVVPSSNLKPLFSHILDLKTHEHAIDIENKQESHFLIDQNHLFLPLRYESPLSTFRSYRGCSPFTDVFHFSTSSNTWTHNIDPYKLLCKYEHRGKCNNYDCNWQHKRDYILGPDQVFDQLQGFTDVNTGMNERDGTERLQTNSICTILSWLSDSNVPSKGREENGKVVSPDQRWNTYIAKVPIYRIGSYLMKTECLESQPSVAILKHQLGIRQSLSVFLPGVRQLPNDMPCLLDSSLKLPTLGNALGSMRQFSVGFRAQVDFEGHFSNSVEDVESLLEAALNLIDFNLNMEKSEAQKNALCLLSRGLEAQPSSVALWVVYLSLFYRHEKNIGEEDLFYHAVQHNKGSYELWMMFINSRRHLTERLEAYESAIVAIGRKFKNQGGHLTEMSSFLLDFALQMLNCLCVSHLSQKAVAWIDELASLASESVQCVEGCDASSASILIACLTKHDICILWICCACVIIQLQLPTMVIERLGCKQQLLFCDIWHDKKVQKQSAVHAMRLMHVAASRGRGCLALDSVTFLLDKETQRSKEALAVNFSQCAAVCEGLDSSLTLVDKLLKLYPSSIELILLRVHLEEHLRGKMEGLKIFEEALLRWPSYQAGKLRLWNQYIGYAFKAKGIDFVKLLFARCVTQVRDTADICGSIGENLGSYYPPTSCRESKINHKGLQTPTPNEDLDDGVRQTFQFLPTILKQQTFKGSGFKHGFSNQDAVFGFLNLAFFEAISGDIVAANNAIDDGLKIAADVKDVLHCIKEMAALTCFRSVNPTSLTSSLLQHKVISLVDRCFVESQVLKTIHTLSKGFCESIKSRRVRLCVEHLLGPWPTDNSLFNIILETIYGSTLLPDETVTMKDLIEFVDKIMEVTPTNVRLAASACRAVQSRMDTFNDVAKSAVLFWSISLLLDSLCQSSPEPPEPVWVEAGTMAKLLGVDILLEDFYQRALVVYPFSTALWRDLLAVSSRTGNLKLVTESALKAGVRLDIDLGV